MPRPNYGNAVKQRTIEFFTVVVDYANGELDLEECQLEQLQRDIQLHWQTEKRCVIRTKVRYLEDLARLAEIILTSAQIKESIKCLTDFLEIIEDNRASKGGSETWHFTLNLWYDRFDRSANIQRFETEWDRRKSPQNQVDIAPTDYWLELVRSSLAIQQYHRLTTNPLMGEDRLKFSLEEVYVPLGSIEKPPVTIVDIPAGVDSVGEESGANHIPDPDRLLAKLFTNPVPNRIGIIGEPGSGKTTCLQKLAAGLLADSGEQICHEQQLPIWISLADLQGETLENYLLQDWLKLVTRKIEIDPKLQQDFVAEFDRGRVWLLLDAVDEMAIDASIALTNLARQLRGWVGGAHIILTCRSNVWDSGKNALESFTTYRNLSLSHGYSQPQNQVKQFIQGWFKTHPNLGEQLVTELAQPQYQRLRDAIKNPLRLALLCRYWLLTQGKLPSTKASLYRQFTDTIYEWKQDRFPTSLAQRQQLDRALGKLAFQSINRDRFRLHEHTILEVLEPDLLELALQLGWLNRVGIAVATGAKIYAFYHSTFQEYFAARSIPDWHYFFDGDLTHHPAIFNPYWHETILFWFGRGDVAVSEKEVCLAALINFDRGCGGFYYYRAYFLAAAVIAEFPESSCSQQIIDQLLQWRFAKFIPDQNTWKFYPLPIQDGARLALRKTDRIAAIAGLERFIQTVENPFLRWQAAHSLGKVFDQGNAIASQALVNSISSVNSSDLLIKICESLTKIDPNCCQIAINKLVDLIQTQKSPTLTRKAAFTLGKLLVEHSSIIDEDRSLLTLAIDTLLQLIESGQSIDNQMAALENLRQLAPNHPTIQQQVINDKTLPSSTYNRRRKASQPRAVSIAIAELERKLTTAKNDESQRQYAYQLGKFQPGHPIAVTTLLQLMSSTQPASFYKRTGEYIKEIVLDQQLALVISTLKQQVIDVEIGDRSTQGLECYKLLWYCAQQLPCQKFVQIWEQ
jgi:ABC-type oligopeptide transport system ATPase subunit